MTECHNINFKQQKYINILIIPFNKTINEVVSDKMVDEWFSITRLDKNFYQVHQKIDNYDVEEILTDIFGEYPVRDN